MLACTANLYSGFKLSLFQYRFNFDPENFRNPQLSRFYAYIEAIALEKEAVEEPEDTINPSPQTIDSRLGQVGLEFVRCFGLQPGSGGGQGAKTTGAKRKGKNVFFYDCCGDLL